MTIHLDVRANRLPPVSADTYLTHSAVETEQLAASLTARFGPGTTFLLTGALGVGKTAFVRGLARGLGLDEEAVSSPTFVLIQEYRGSTPLYHVDLYRLDGAEVDDLGLEELTDGDAVVAIEWAEKLARGIDGAVRVAIDDVGGDTRRITVSRPELST